MAFKILDRAKMAVSGSPGAGDITLGGAVTGYQSFSQAGVNDGDSFPYSILDGNNWEYGVATFVFSSNQISRTVTKTSAQNATPLSLTSRAVVTACVRAEDITQSTTFATLSDVEISTGPGIDGQVVYWNDTDGFFETKSITYAGLPDPPSIPSNAGFLLKLLGDVSMTPSAFTDSYAITWNQTAGKFVLTPQTTGSALNALSDVTITSPANKDILQYSSGTSRWTNAPAPGGAISTLSDVTLTSLATNQILQYNGTVWVNVAIPAQTLVGLSDVAITTGGGVDGYVVYWNNTSGNFELKAESGGGSSLAVLDNGTSVDTAAVSLNFINATSITTSSHAVTITLPTGGGGSPTYAPPVQADLTTYTLTTGATIHQRTSGAVPSLGVLVTSGGTSSGTCYGLGMTTTGLSTFSVVGRVTTTLGTITGNWCGAGISVFNSANSHAETIFINTESQIYMIDWTSSTGNTTNGGVAVQDGEYFLHLDYDGTNLKFGMSRNGADVLSLRSIVVSSTIGAITDAGIFWGGGTTMIHNFTHFHLGALGTNGL